MQFDEEVELYCEVWELNLPALKVFLGCSDDWKTDAAGNLRSIDKTALGAVMEMMGVSDRKEMFNLIIDMQNAALEVLRNG